ncbi:MAG: hypothetical protein LBL35_03120 [Clostridiales bacterium]|jgi:hypothetical protein|nr:hypothetical protein [Clostridiales bacterium]
MMKISVPNTERFIVSAPERDYFGGSQEWYEDARRKKSGCGAVAAANIIWYMAKSDGRFRGLADIDGGGKDSFIKLMEEMFSYITPGPFGVNRPEMFSAGAICYAAERGVDIKAKTLEAFKPGKIDLEEARGFVSSCLAESSPTAFLNLSNGALKNLDNWHWVTIIAIDDETNGALICDAGNSFEINFGEWVETTLLGGAFVALH